jgi:pimeloyl-ACP methyl ester carboxylesterase
MKNCLLRSAIIVLAFVGVICAGAAAPEESHYTYVIVHGAWGGGWAFREVDRLLTADGHKVFRPTLTGQGEKMHLASPEVGLATHVNDIVNVILFEDLHDIVLVGHSYGGMVITGVMDRVPERIRHVIFLDAAVPNDGESFLDLRGGVAPFAVKGGFILPSAEAAAKPIPHDVPQSLKTWSEPVSFKNPAARLLPVTFVRFVAAGQTSGERKGDLPWQRAGERGWTRRTMVSDHNAQWSHPGELAALLEEAPRDRNRPAIAPAGEGGYR